MPQCYRGNHPLTDRRQPPAMSPETLCRDLFQKCLFTRSNITNESPNAGRAMLSNHINPRAPGDFALLFATARRKKVRKYTPSRRL